MTSMAAKPVRFLSDAERLIRAARERFRAGEGNVH
jgi:hypothetical protein